MNEKIAREARQINRIHGTLGKRGDSKPYKLPRKVKAHWATLSHRQRGKMSRVWRAEIAAETSR